MVPTSDHRVSPLRTRRYRCRVAEHEAKKILRDHGHAVVVRSTDPDFPASLIAWSGAGGVHVFRVVSTRRPVAGAPEVASLFRGEIDELRSIPWTPGGSLNIWVRADRKAWYRFRVFPGGIAETEVPDVA
ncbi:MAG TPA: hypothetical protein P5515_10275 [Methanolinea sp.]|nr:hypothetical protein [Methanolinea sp.]